MAGLQAAACSDADELLAAELDELLEDDRRAGAAHPRPLHRDRLAPVGARVPEQPALGVPLDDVLEERLGDVLGAERVAGSSTASAYSPGSARMWIGMAGDSIVTTDRPAGEQALEPGLSDGGGDCRIRPGAEFSEREPVESSWTSLRGWLLAAVRTAAAPGRRSAALANLVPRARVRVSPKRRQGSSKMIIGEELGWTSCGRRPGCACPGRARIAWLAGLRVTPSRRAGRTGLRPAMDDLDPDPGLRRRARGELGADRLATTRLPQHPRADRRGRSWFGARAVPCFGAEIRPRQGRPYPAGRSTRPRGQGFGARG
jgi:hypothetical protein